MMWGHGWGDWLWMGLGLLVFWGGMVTVVVFAFRAWGRNPSHQRGAPRAPDAHDILAERFARGEISEDEFERRRHVLEHQAT
ncbi:MAG: SHOCT domain-containing protein [Actinomycetota bacterium]